MCFYFCIYISWKAIMSDECDIAVPTIAFLSEKMGLESIGIFWKRNGILKIEPHILLVINWINPSAAVGIQWLGKENIVVSKKTRKTRAVLNFFDTNGKEGIVKEIKGEVYLRIYLTRTWKIKGTGYVLIIPIMSFFWYCQGYMPIGSLYPINGKFGSFNIFLQKYTFLLFWKRNGILKIVRYMIMTG